MSDYPFGILMTCSDALRRYALRRRVTLALIDSPIRYHHARPKQNRKGGFALLGAFEFENGWVWKRFDFDVMQSLADQGLISDPRGKSESVRLTPEGLARAKALADQLFSP